VRVGSTVLQRILTVPLAFIRRNNPFAKGDQRPGGGFQSGVEHVLCHGARSNIAASPETAARALANTARSLAPSCALRRGGRVRRITSLITHEQRSHEGLENVVPFVDEPLQSTERPHGFIFWWHFRLRSGMKLPSVMQELLRSSVHFALFATVVSPVEDLEVAWGYIGRKGKGKAGEVMELVRRDG